MKDISTGDVLFENWLDGSSRLAELEQFLDYVDGFLKNEEKYFAEEAHPDLEIEFLPLFADKFPSIFHSSFLISVVMFLEQEIRGFSQALLKQLNPDVKFGDLAGNVLERFRISLTLCAIKVDLKEIGWEDIVGIFEIRNCLVHSSGNLNEFSKFGSVISFSTRHGLPVILENRLLMSSQMSRASIRISERFFDNTQRIAITHFGVSSDNELTFRACLS